MKKLLMSSVAGLFVMSALIGCAGKEEGDTAATTPPATTSADDAPKETPTATKMAGGGGGATTPGKADDMPEKTPEGETKPEAKPDEHAGHNHAPGEGH